MFVHSFRCWRTFGFRWPHPCLLIPPPALAMRDSRAWHTGGEALLWVYTQQSYCWVRRWWIVFQRGQINIPIGPTNRARKLHLFHFLSYIWSCQTFYHFGVCGMVANGGFVCISLITINWRIFPLPLSACSSFLPIFLLGLWSFQTGLRSSSNIPDNDQLHETSSPSLGFIHFLLLLFLNKYLFHEQKYLDLT